ncbi:tumor protein p53-inducible nuclear protein 1-like [Hoplias malabaricus]|uniref:tumor protein p53-inducible nuclear protein 1-like n=1 Tax=Hoplias malabaricus TaxID=27720 RepID=UPI0034623588
MMIGRILAQVLGGADDAEVAVETEGCQEVFEFEDGEWVIINIQENRSGVLLEEDPLENLLIEHPSMSVYQLHRRNQEEQEEEEEEEEDSPRSVVVRRPISWCVSECGGSLSVLLSLQRSKCHMERKTLSRGALHRQNLVNTRFSPTDRRYGHFKQPTQRPYNY